MHKDNKELIEEFIKDNFSFEVDEETEEVYLTRFKASLDRVNIHDCKLPAGAEKYYLFSRKAYLVGQLSNNQPWVDLSKACLELYGSQPNVDECKMMLERAKNTNKKWNNLYSNICDIDKRLINLEEFGVVY
nr:hypothetical protein [uncultured Mediterranean phage uvMED]